MIFGTSDSGILQGLKKLVTASLLLIYIAGNFHLDGLHKAAHHHEEVSHTSVDEEDACHRAIYHSAKDACSHESHVSEKVSCKLCDTVYHADQGIAENVLVNQKSFFDAFYDDVECALSHKSFRTLTSRGPPAV